MKSIFLLKTIYYIFGIFLLTGACLMVCTQRLMYAIFSLVFVFFSGIWFFVIYNAEYAMLIFLVVYLGAIVVFFVFIIMLLNPSLLEIRVSMYNSTVFNYSGLYLFSLLLLLFLTSRTGSDFDCSNILVTIQESASLHLTNVEKIGLLLYLDYGILLIITGYLLFVSILGAVLLLKNVKQND